VVVRLGIAGAGVLVVGDLPMGFLGQWWCVAAEGEDEFCAVAVVGIEVVEFENVVKMGVVGYGGGAVAGTEDFASTPTSEGFQCCTRALQVLLSLC
jgi:hypothetical protein